jgi:hypothetical protein
VRVDTKTGTVSRALEDWHIPPARSDERKICNQDIIIDPKTGNVSRRL